MRLKDKLGTRQLPTAELILRGSIGTRVSDIGVGIKSIASMLNVTRIHNACASVSGMRRIIALASDYAQRRVAFGKKIGEHGLHNQTLEKLEMTFRGNLLLILETASLLQETDNKNFKNENLFRLITAVVKAFTAKDCMNVISEGLECFGGLGYMENSGLPRILRDA